MGLNQHTPNLTCLKTVVKYTAFMFLFSVISVSCTKKKPQIPDNKLNQNDSSSSEIIRLNQLLVEVEENEIKAYIDSSSYPFSAIESGMWMSITKQGNGKKIEKNSLVEVAYQVETLQGKICYTFTEQLKKQFVVGKLEKQRGLNIALTYLKEGDEAIFIVPSNLAYGALGDTKSIPPRASIIYRIFTIKNTY